MNPFADDVFSGSLTSEPTFPALYAGELDRLAEWIRAMHRSPGRLSQQKGLAALLISPQAGAGKSHFLARLASERKANAHFVALQMDDVDEMTWERWLHQFVERLQASTHVDGDHTALTAVAAALFADVTGSLVAEGKIPCSSPAVASQWLLENSVKLFDYSERKNPSVAWFHGEFPRLLPALVDRCARDLDLDRALLVSRLEWLYEYASLSSSEQPLTARREAQREFLQDAEILAISGEASAKREWKWFGRVVSWNCPLVLTVDDLDWGYRDEASALRLARMLSEMSRMVPNSLALISVNEDNWKETFERGLPGAVVDRLTSFVTRLEGIPQDLWKAFLAERADDAAEDGRLDSVVTALVKKCSDDAAIMPRKLLRLAAPLWPTSAVAAPQVYAKPEVARAEEEPSTTTTAAAPEIAPQPVQRWAHAIGDLRTLIQQRGHESSISGGDGGVVTPFIDVSSKAPESTKPDGIGKPELTPEFRSFLSSLRARATDKAAYMPQGTPVTAEERARERSRLILHGREGDAQQRNQVAVSSEAPAGIKTQRISVKPTDTPVEFRHRLRELKLRFAEAGGSLEIQMHRVRRLISTAGRLFPAISQETLGAANDSLCELRWKFQQSEVNFGFRSFEDVSYWQHLVKVTGQRARDLRHSESIRVKLAVFGRTRQEDCFPSTELEDDGVNDLQFCDLILLTDHQLLSIYAIDELVNVEIAQDQREALFAQVSGEIDFFWKMITRPVWTLVSPTKRPALS